MDDSIKAAVIAAVLDVARVRRPDVTEVAERHRLGADLGFDSLDLAQVAAELEVRLGIDPFAKNAASRVITVADLVALYEKHRAA